MAGHGMNAHMVGAMAAEGQLPCIPGVLMEAQSRGVGARKASPSCNLKARASVVPSTELSASSSIWLSPLPTGALPPPVHLPPPALLFL